MIWHVTWWKAFPRSLLDRPALQSHGFVIFSKASHMNTTSITLSIHETLSMVFLFISHLTTQKKNMGLYSEVEKDAQPCSRWGNLTGSPAISWHEELQRSLIPATHCHSWSSREHKAHCKCFSREVVQLSHPPQLCHGKGP